MNYCEQCGSTSHDAEGFCSGCGTRLPGYAATQAQGAATTHQGKPPGIVLPEQVRTQTSGLWGVAQPDGEKNVWVAVLLALFLGPFGMTYCTYLGAFVMFTVTLFAWLLMRNLAILYVLQLVCVVWAGWAAKRANSIY